MKYYATNHEVRVRAKGMPLIFRALSAMVQRITETICPVIPFRAVFALRPSPRMGPPAKSLAVSGR